MAHQIGDIVAVCPVEDYPDEIWVYGKIDSVEQINEKELLEELGLPRMDAFKQSYPVIEFKHGLHKVQILGIESEQLFVEEILDDDDTVSYHIDRFDITIKKISPSIKICPTCHFRIEHADPDMLYCEHCGSLLSKL
jgi:hypothetical protein